MENSEISDAQILEAVQKTLTGDKNAFSLIIRRYEPLLSRIASSYLGGSGEEKDAVQEIFIRIFRSLSSYRIEKSFTPWIISATFNYIKTYKSRLIRLPLATDKTEHLISRANPQKDLAEEELIEGIQRAIKKLPADLKEAVILYYLEEYSVKESAELLGITEENMKSRLFRARKALRRLLTNIYP